MKNMKKMLGIFLSLTMLLTMIPAGMVSAADDEDYQVAASEICFADIKAENTNGQFNVTADLNLFTQYTADDGKTYEVEWVSTNTDVISTTGTVADVTADTWVDIYAVVKDDETDATSKGGTMKICVKAPVAEENILFYEDFEDFTLTDGVYTFTEMKADTDEDGWYIAPPSNHQDAVATNGNTKFTVRDTVLDKADLAVSGKVLRMDAVTTDKCWNNQLTNVFANSAPTSGIVTYSADILVSGKSTNFIFFPFWQQKTTEKIQFPYGSNTSIDKKFGINVWYNIETVYNLETGMVTGYVNGVEYATAEKAGGDFLKQIQLRLYENAGDYTFVDNIKVTVKTFDAESAALAAFNPVNQSSAYKNSNYVDMNLNNTVTVGGTAYDVTYTSDDTGVIAADGTVTLPDFVSYVTVTPSITVDGVKISGAATTLIVLPAKKSVGMFEDFEDLAAGSLLNATTGANDNVGSSWSASVPANYVKGVTNGAPVANVVEADSAKSLNLKWPAAGASGVDHMLFHPITADDCGDRIAFIFDMKNNSTGYIGFGSNFSGLFRGSLWRGNYNNVKVDNSTDLVPSATIFKNNKDWQTFMFIYDTGVTKTIGTTTVYPMSLYVDGVYYGTNWTSLSLDSLALVQDSDYGASDISIDNILVMNFDAKELQLAGTTVDGGVLTTADVQYVSYEDDLTGTKTIIAAAYNNKDELVDVSIVPNVAVNAIGNNTVTVNYTLPSNAVKYRLFLFDSIDNISPLALSKIYDIAE